MNVRFTISSLFCAILVALTSIIIPLPILAQGEEFTKSSTEYFSFVYRRRYQPLLETTMSNAESARTEILNNLGDPREEPVVEVRFARNIDEMHQLCPRQPPGWADAVAFWPDNIIVISLTTTHHRRASIETVFRHELSHLALRWVVGDAKIPRWFNEGLAIKESGELSFERWKLLWPVASRGTITPIRRLDRGFPAKEFQVNQAYAESADFVRFLSNYKGEWRIKELLQRVSKGEPFYKAMRATWNSTERGIERRWHDDLRRRYSAIPAITAASAMWVGVGALAVVAFIRRRRDVRRRIDAMDDDEEDE